MKVLTCLGLVALSAANASSISEATAVLPQLPMPPHGQIQWVARSMRMNGLPMTIQTLASRDVPNEVIRFYETWARREGGSQTRRWRTHDSEVVSIKAPSYIATIELQQVVNGTRGTIVTSSPLEKTALNTATRFPHPSSWRVANLQQYEDDGKETEYIDFTSSRAPTTEAQAIIDLLGSSGWTLIDKSSDIETVYMEARRNAEAARVILSKATDHHATTLVAVLWCKG